MKANGYLTHASHRKDPANLATVKTATTAGTDPTTRTHQLPRRLDSDMYVGLIYSVCYVILLRFIMKVGHLS